MYVKSFKELIVWQKSITLVKEVYGSTAEFPKTEVYGLSAQMRRSVISIPSNIAEGYKRKGRKEFLQFLSIAEASAAELETQIIISKELYPTIPITAAESLLDEIQRMLSTMIRKLSA